MNTALLHEIADAIEKEPKQFDQKDYGRIRFSGYCKSPCCVGGWAIILSGKQALPGPTANTACQVLGICPEQGHYLFLPTWPDTIFPGGAPKNAEKTPGSRRHIPTAEEAVVVLRRLADGELSLVDFKGDL